MNVNIQAKMLRAQRLNNWNDAEVLIDALIQEAGLTSEDEVKRQVAWGEMVAAARNAKDRGGKKV